MSTTSAVEANLLIQNNIEQSKSYADSDHIIVDKSTGETLTHRLYNLNLAKHNLGEVVKQVETNKEAVNSVEKDLITKIDEVPVIGQSSINGNILVDDKETTVYTPNLSITRYSEDIPKDTKSGEIYMILLDDEDEGE